MFSTELEDADEDLAWITRQTGDGVVSVCWAVVIGVEVDLSACEIRWLGCLQVEDQRDLNDSAWSTWLGDGCEDDPVGRSACGLCHVGVLSHPAFR